MPANQNPVCSKCGLVMGVVVIGLEAVYMAHDPPEPYEIRSGDLCECPGCGSRVLTKWASTSTFPHDGQAFDHRLLAADAIGKALPIWERKRDPLADPTARELFVAWLTKRAEARKAATP